MVPLWMSLRRAPRDCPEGFGGGLDAGGGLDDFGRGFLGGRRGLASRAGLAGRAGFVRTDWAGGGVTTATVEAFS